MSDAWESIESFKEKLNQTRALYQSLDRKASSPEASEQDVELSNYIDLLIQCVEALGEAVEELVTEFEGLKGTTV